MTRVNGKNNMRTPEEKEMWVLKYLNGEIGIKPGARKIGIQECVFRRWIKKYKENGFDGLISKTGTKRGGNKGQGKKKCKTREEKLERENAKLKIEIERLKKGYYVKGVGQRKEYVSINNRSIKSSEN